MSAMRICIIYKYVLYTFSPILVNNSSIPVNEFVNTVDGKFFKDLGRFEIEIEDSKNMGGKYALV